MQTYKIITKSINKRIKTNLSLSFLETSPALFFLCNGEYQIQECGQITATKLIKDHIKTIVNKLRYFNEAR